MKKNLFTFLTIFFSFIIAYGQDNLVVNLVDNNSIPIVLSTIQKITFLNNNMVLKTTNGDENSYLLDNIAAITFFNNVGIEVLTEPIDLHFFVNSSGNIIVETSRQIYQMTVFDITGRKVAETAQSTLNVNSFNIGVYILQVSTDKGLVSKKFIKNR